MQRSDWESIRQDEGWTSWRFWGLYIHVCKMETPHEA